ncbi:MAG TPA: tetraacyldisaccharide 4'-kinase [Phycisphaerae bacterium]|nr:tetraacyldisaccharide 4'-kinase [Phycisphaerae bacterium]
MEQWYRSIISGERAGAFPAILRFVLEVLSWGYALIIYVRNFLYDVGVFKQVRLPVPVISVGNITTGGTGKTPTVIMLAKELQKLGRKPAVLTRGYGAPKGGKSDEVMVIEQECPGVPVVVNPDRVAGGREAIEKFGADVLLMDDGYQHRRLARDLNILLVDATEPLGIPGVLPRGTWREPPHNMKRANMIMLTRCEQVTPELAELAAGLLTQWVSPRAIFQQRTTVAGLHDSGGGPVPLVAGGRRVFAFAGIGNPAGFLHTVRSLGMHVSAAVWFDDHHHYHLPRDLAGLARAAAERRPDALVTTLKDWVKLRGKPLPPGLPIWHVRIEARLSTHEQELLRSRLALLTRPGAGEHAARDEGGYAAPAVAPESSVH